MVKKPKRWAEWIDPCFENMSFAEIFGEPKQNKKKKKGKVTADIDFSIGV